MTTIAFRNGIVAADTRGTQGNLILPEIEQKLFVVPKEKGGGLITMVGTTFVAKKLVDRLLRGDAPDVDLGDEAHVIHFERPGVITVYEGDYHFTCYPNEFMAWGSGRAYALGAMEMGADAVKAVEVAAKFDSGSGTPVRWIALEDTWVL